MFDCSEGRDPLEFTFGAGRIIRALEEGSRGLAVGDMKTVRIETKDAYGEYDENLVIEVSKDLLPADLDLTGCPEKVPLSRESFDSACAVLFPDFAIHRYENIYF